MIWEEETDAGVQRIAVLDVGTGRIRRVGTLLTGRHMIGPGIADFVGNANGAVIWLDDVGSQVGPFSSFASTLYENSRQGTIVLDRATNGTPVFPISAFGLSSNGRVVYWTDDGRLKSARISR